MTTFGLDISNHNAGLSLADAKRQGFEFVEVKCTEGTSYADPYYDGFRKDAQANGFLFAAYHALHAGNARAQADWFCSHIGDMSIRAMVDFEPFGDNPTRADAVAFVKRCREHGVTVTLDYLPNWYWLRLAVALRSLKRLPQLVSSNYPDRRHVHGSVGYASAGGDSGPGWARYGGRRPVIWQFTDNGLVDGYGGGVDLDAFRGSRSELAALGVFTDYAAKPERPHTPRKPKPKARHRWFWFPGFWPRWHKANPHRKAPTKRSGK